MSGAPGRAESVLLAGDPDGGAAGASVKDRCHTDVNVEERAMDIRSLLSGGRRGVPSLFGEGDPFTTLQREMNRLFEDTMRATGTLVPESVRVMPRIDVRETDKGLEVTAEIPGVDEKDIDVELVDDVLTIRGEKRAESRKEEKGVYMLERSFGSFSRSIPLPFAPDPDAVEAAFEKGVLRIMMPQPPQAREKSRKIAVKGTAGPALGQAGAGQGEPDQTPPQDRHAAE